MLESNNNLNKKNSKLIKGLISLLENNKFLFLEKKKKSKKVREINLSLQLCKLIRRNKRFKKNFRVFKKRLYYGLTILNKKYRRKFRKIVEYIRKQQKFFLNDLFLKMRNNVLYSRNSVYRFTIVWRRWKMWKRNRKKFSKKRFYSNYFYFHRVIKRYNKILLLKINNNNPFLNFLKKEENFLNRVYLRRNNLKYNRKYLKEIKKKTKSFKKRDGIYLSRRVDKRNPRLIQRLINYLNFFNDKLFSFKKKYFFRVHYNRKKAKQIYYLKEKKELLKSYIGYINIILKKYVKTSKLPIFENSIKESLNGLTTQKKIEEINILSLKQKRMARRLKILAQKMRTKNIMVNIIFTNIKIKSLDYAISPSDKIKLFHNYWNLNSVYLKFIGFILKNGKRSKAELILNKSLYLIKELIFCNPLFFFIKSVYNSQSIFEFSKQKKQNRTLLIPRITPYNKRVNLAIRSITKNIRNNEMLRRIKKLNKKNQVNTSYILYNILISHFFIKGEIRKELISNVKNAFKQKQFLRKGMKSNRFSFNRLLKYLSFKKLRGYHF
jgi:ribosomal protein S7